MDNKKKNNIKVSRWVVLTLFFVVSVALLTYFYPREGRSLYVFHEGRPWSYSLLTAPFDFPIYKDDDLIRREQDSILVTFKPIYRIDDTIGKTMVARFDSVLMHYPAIPIGAAYRKAYCDTLKSIYDAGIVSAECYTALQTGQIPGIRVLQNNLAKNYPTQKLLSPKAAYERFLDAYPDTYSRHILQSTGLNDFLVENILPDSVTTQKVRDEYLQQISLSQGMVQAGERIVDRGEIVTPEIYRILKSYEMVLAKKTATDARHEYFTIAGQAVVFSCAIAFLFLFLALFRHRLFRQNKVIGFIMLLVVAVSIAAFTVTRFNFNAIFLIPFAIIPIIMVTFFDSRVALYVHLVTVIICSFAAPAPLLFFFLQLIVGMAAIDSLNDLSKRSQLFRCSIIVFVAYGIAYMGYTLFTEGDIMKVDLTMLLYLAINCVLLLFTYLLIYIFERTFGFLSSVTLVELSDINSPLLLRLSEEAPGTFQHAMQVSNLAAAAAIKVGANAQLVRTGALYHDIGKLSNPAFFTENQGGNINPHKDLPLEESARIIISHVADGLKMAEKAGLPPQVREFIATHHGHGKAKYFYNTYCNQHPGEPVDEEKFTYPGHNPQTKETGMLMMADAVEAASRSLKEYNETSISQLVNRIIDSQIADGLLKETPLSFRDVETIKEVFTEKLMTMYHTRISYPTLQRPSHQA